MKDQLKTLVAQGASASSHKVEGKGKERKEKWSKQRKKKNKNKSTGKKEKKAPRVMSLCFCIAICLSRVSRRGRHIPGAEAGRRDPWKLDKLTTYASHSRSSSSTFVSEGFLPPLFLVHLW